MPINPQDLLDQAKRLIGAVPGAVEADLRRGISSAYYALFHLLIQETMSSVVIDPSFRPKVARGAATRIHAECLRQVQSRESE